MSEISRVALFGKLNSVAYKAIEGATVFCKLRGNPYVELEHWVMQIVQAQDTDWHRSIKHFGLDVDRAGQGHHQGARSAAARLDLDLRPGREYLRCRRARLGLWHAEVRRIAGTHRASAVRHAQDAFAGQPAARHLEGIRARSSPTFWATNSPRSSPARRKKICAPATVRASAANPAKPAARWRPPRWASRKR